MDNGDEGTQNDPSGKGEQASQGQIARSGTSFVTLLEKVVAQAARPISGIEGGQEQHLRRIGAKEIAGNVGRLRAERYKRAQAAVSKHSSK